MIKVKRKPRKKESKKNLDLLSPLPLDQIGTEDDPCFGKLFDPRTPECSKCGDSEICSIVMGQRNHGLRLNEEKKHSFKDLEELKIKPEDKKVMVKKIKNRIREIIKTAGGKEVSMELVETDIFVQFGRDGFNSKRIIKLINKVVEGSNLITLSKNKLKWNKPTQK